MPHNGAKFCYSLELFLGQFPLFLMLCECSLSSNPVVLQERKIEAKQHKDQGNEYFRKSGR